MNQGMAQKLKKSLTLHEGYHRFPYPDTVGKITIGIGYNLTDRGIDDDWINDQYVDDVNYFYNNLIAFPWFNKLNDDRKVILIDMAFMGWKKFLEFEKMIEALHDGDYVKAASEMMNSKWAEQVKGRAIALSHAMITGIYDI